MFVLTARPSPADTYLAPPSPPTCAQPPADNSGPVFVLTAKTFNETVFKGDRDWFIEFYAPWWLVKVLSRALAYAPWWGAAAASCGAWMDLNRTVRLVIPS